MPGIGVCSNATSISKSVKGFVIRSCASATISGRLLVPGSCFVLYVYQRCRYSSLKPASSMCAAIARAVRSAPGEPFAVQSTIPSLQILGVNLFR